MFKVTIKLLSCAALLGCVLAVSEEKLEFTTTQIPTLANSVASFALKLHKLLLDEVLNSASDGNIIFSPLNIYHALALAHLGAVGETQNEISQAMSWPTSVDGDAHKSFGEILHQLETSQVANLSLAAKIFMQQTFPVKEKYQELSARYYNTSVEIINFASGGDYPMNVINEWVSEKTHGEINKLFENPIPSDTAVMLVSALHFSALWDQPFDKALTKQNSFHSANSGAVPVKMMQGKRDIRNHINDDLQYHSISLPYSRRSLFKMDDDSYNMVIILPEGDQTLANLSSLLTLETLFKVLAEDHSWTEVKMPLFDIKQHIELVPILQKLGVRKAFEKFSADFSAMNENVVFKNATHDAQIEVTESGTVASAATVFSFNPRTFPRYTFVADRPFIFYIQHEPTDMITLWGVVSNPNKK